MNNFIEDIKEDNKSKHTIWVEKFRPTTLDDYIAEKSFKDSLKMFIDKQDIPHLLFHNVNPGSGKTSAAKLLINNIKCDYLYINASDENGIDTIRSKIKDFASTTGFNSLKIVVLDEADFLTIEGMSALRNILETFSATTRFILTCNYVEKIIPAIISRCQVFKVEAPSKKDVAMLLKSILDKELTGYTVEDLAYIVHTYYPDMRKIINYSQQSITDNKIVINKKNAVDTDIKLKILDLLKNEKNNPTTFNNIRQLVANNDIKFFDEYYKFLYDNIAEYSNSKTIPIIIEISESLYQSTLIIDKEICFMALIAKILKDIK